MVREIRFGVQTAPQNTSWQDLCDAWTLIDSLEYDTAWVFDHFFPILSNPSGPCLEGWVALAGLAALTSRVRVGVLVTGNTYRYPAVLAKMGATLDHTSGGRLIMGLGAGWFEGEHNAYGIPFYTVGERIRRLDEAAAIIRRLWTERQTTFEGRYYTILDAWCEPKPVQKPRPPIMIGGAGEKLTLRVVARHADLWNTFGSVETFRHKIEILRGHCEEIGRDPGQIEISWAGVSLVTDSASVRETAIRKAADAFHESPDLVEPRLLIGSVSQIRDRIDRYIEAGVTHFITLASAPFDLNSIRRFAEEIIPHYRAKGG
jgi:F420-dependent oxidoreductase-like protein